MSDLDQMPKCKHGSNIVLHNCAECAMELHGLQFCDCCGNYSLDATDEDGDGNSLGHVQCAHCGLQAVVLHNTEKLAAEWKRRYDGQAILLSGAKEALRKLRRENEKLQTVDDLRVQYLELALSVFETIGNRCMAADGPVTTMLREITGEEMERIYKLIRSAHGGKPICVLKDTERSARRDVEPGTEMAGSENGRIEKHGGPITTENHPWRK